MDGARAFVAAQFAAGGFERIGEARKQGGRDRGVDQHRFGRTADADAAQLGVEDDGLGLGGIRLGVDVGVAQAFEVADDGDARFLLHAGDEALAAAGHDNIELAAEAGEKMADSRAIGRLHELDRILRQADIGKAGAEAVRDRAR